MASLAKDYPFPLLDLTDIFHIPTHFNDYKPLYFQTIQSKPFQKNSDEFTIRYHYLKNCTTVSLDMLPHYRHVNRVCWCLFTLLLLNLFLFKNVSLIVLLMMVSLH